MESAKVVHWEVPSKPPNGTGVYNDGYNARIVRKLIKN